MNGLDILRIGRVMERTGLSRTTIWRMVKAGTFPKPVELGSRARGWRSKDVDKWLEDRPVAGESALPEEALAEESAG